MVWDFVFGFTNMIAIAGWIALALLPRWPTVLSLVLYAGVGLLCLTYGFLFVTLVGNLIDSGGMAGAGGPGSFTSIEGIRALFMSDGGIVIGWTHYLAFDLFVGLWISRDADHKGFSRIVQIPFLVATLIAGPIGLGSWLIVREARARRLAKR